jgi:type IV fimbrial biogenesis protein FimT
MITLALVGIIVGLAAPSFATLIANSRLASTSNDVVGALNYARSEAVKTGRNVIVNPAAGSNWANGISIWIDRNGDGSMDVPPATPDSEEIRRIPEAPGSVTVTASSSGAAVSNFVFTGAGNSSGAVTIQVCDDRSGESGREITITLGGRVRGEDFTC